MPVELSHSRAVGFFLFANLTKVGPNVNKPNTASAARGNTHMAALNRSLDHFTCPRTAPGNVSL